MKNILHDTERGYLIIICMILLLVLSSVGVSIGTVVSARYASNSRAVYVDSAVMVAEAGISDTVEHIIDEEEDHPFTGYPNNNRKEFFNNADQGKGEYSTTVTAPTPDTRVITSTGYVYPDPGSTDNEIKKTIKATIKANINPTQYSVFTGSGGLSVGNFVTLQGANIYIQGRVNLGSFSGIGTNANPVDLNVGNIGCRAGGTGSQYPVLCTSQPLTLSGFNSAIYGTVCATGQVTSTGIFPGSTGQGLIEDCEAPFGAMPSFNKAAFTAGKVTQAANNARCTLPSISTTWQANTKFDGSVSFPSLCQVTVRGDIYINGNLTANNIQRFVVDESLTEPPVIVVNGNVTLNFARVSANSAGVPMRIISFGSTESGCTMSDSCNTLSTYDHIYNSTNTTTASCAGSPWGSMPGLILQSYFGRVSVGFGCSVGSVAGQAVHFDFFGGTSLVGQLSLEGTITYDSWRIVDYRQLY